MTRRKTGFDPADAFASTKDRNPGSRGACRSPNWMSVEALRKNVTTLRRRPELGDFDPGAAPLQDRDRAYTREDPV